MAIQSKINTPDLTKSEVLEKYKKYLAYIFNFDLAEEAFNLVKALPKILARIPAFKETYPELYDEYQKIIKTAKIDALPYLKPEEIEEIFTENLLEGLRLDFPDLFEKVEQKSITYLLFEDRDKFKEGLRKAIEKNQEKIGPKDIVLNEKKLPQTVANWIILYRANLHEDEADPLKTAQFFNDNPEIKKLELEDRDLLLKLYSLYTKLGVTSTSLYGLEEKVTFIDENGDKRIFNKGTLEKLIVPDEIKNDLEIAKKVYEQTLGIRTEPVAKAPVLETAPAPSAATPDVSRPAEKGEAEEIKLLREKISSVINAFQKDLKTVQDEEQNLSGLDGGKIQEELTATYNNRQGVRLMACLFRMARLRQIDQILSDDISQGIFIKEVMPIILKQKPDVSAEKLAESFKKEPTNPVYQKIFIKFLVNSAMPGDEAKSAFLMAQLENIFRVQGFIELMDLAYFNLKTGQYEWAKVKFDEGNNLYLE